MSEVKELLCYWIIIQQQSSSLIIIKQIDVALVAQNGILKAGFLNLGQGCWVSCGIKHEYLLPHANQFLIPNCPVTPSVSSVQ
jgi:hypothetical protein